MAYESGAFAPPGLNQLLAAPATAVFNDTLFVFGGSTKDQNGRMYQTTFDLKQLVRPSSPAPPPGAEPIDTDNLTNTSLWTMTNMALTNNTPCTYSRCSAATTPDSLFAFWNHFQKQFSGYSSALLAAKYVSANNWGPTIQLLEMDGKTEPIPLLNTASQLAADVSVTTLGDNFIIVACAQATSATNKTGGIFLGLYDTTKITSNDTWPADWSTYIPLSQLNFDTSDPINNSGPYISIDWFAMVDPTSGELTFYLAIALYPASTNGSLFPVLSPVPDGYMAYVPLTVSSATTGTTVTVDVPASLECYDIAVLAKGNFVSPVVRDPAGRLCAYWFQTTVYNFEYEMGGCYSTTTTPAPSGLPFSRGTFSWYGSESGGRNILPGILFYIFTDGASATTVNGLKATEYPVYMFVFNTVASVYRYGTIQVIPNYNTATPQPDTFNVITGIIDGPLPLPLENYQGYHFTGQLDGGEIIYGTTDSQTLSRQHTHAWTLGVETSGEVTKGWGGAFEISFNGGMGRIAGSSKQTVLSYNLPQTSLVLQADAQNPLRVNPFGTLRKVAAQINATAYVFLDQNGQPVTDPTNSTPGQSPKVATTLATYTDPMLLSYIPYSVTPGSLFTYTPEQWNTTMQNLGYVGSNYYGEVICANAYPLTPAQTWLEFSWSEGTPAAQASQNFTSSFREHSWELSTSVYLGLSWGAGISVFGLGEEGQIKLLFGGTYHYESSHTENKQSGWGINSSLLWGPVVSDNANAITGYSFRLFFLPAPSSPPSSLESTYWTQELKKYMKPGGPVTSDSIDPNSGAWRIVFVVTEIISKNPDPTQNYSYKNNYLDKPSVYAPNNSTEP